MSEADSIDDQRVIPDIIAAMAGIRPVMAAHARGWIQVSRH